jgi:hypothetical protein
MRFRHYTVYLGYRAIPHVDLSPGSTPGKSNTLAHFTTPTEAEPNPTMGDGGGFQGFS